MHLLTTLRLLELAILTVVMAVAAVILASEKQACLQPHLVHLLILYLSLTLNLSLHFNRPLILIL
jgi:hypothetical protein